MAQKVFKNPIQQAQAIQPILDKSLEDKYKEFLKNYSTDVSKIRFAPENGYPQEDAVFDQILIRDFTDYARKNGFEKNLNDFDELVNIDNDEAVDVWNRISDLTKEKVKNLLTNK